jgi:hypothetical protein
VGAPYKQIRVEFIMERKRKEKKRKEKKRSEGIKR